MTKCNSHANSHADKKPSLDQLHATFLALLLPRIEAHGRVVFRNVKCPHQKEEYIAEMVALCWLWLLRLNEQGKDASQFPSALATFSARAVRAGRRLCGQERGKDVLSPLAQQRHHLVVRSLPVTGARPADPLGEALRDNTRTPPDEQAGFRCDFPAWLATRGERDRRIAEDLMLGERTLDVARKHGLSPGRISQKRRELMKDWRHFCGEDDEQPAAARP